MPRSRIFGGPQLRKKLKKAPETIRAGVAKALDESILDVQRRAVALAPVDTGNLRATLGSKQAIGRAEKGMRVEFGLRTKTLKKRAYYALFVEYGTKGYEPGEKRSSGTDAKGKARWQKVNKRVAPRPAQPFLRPALDQARPGIRMRIRKALGQAAKQAGGANWEDARLSGTTVSIGASE